MRTLANRGNVEHQLWLRTRWVRRWTWQSESRKGSTRNTYQKKHQKFERVHRYHSITRNL